MQLVMSALGHKRTLGFRHALGYVAHMERRTEDAKLEYRRAIDLNPNFAAAYGYLGFTLAMAGQSDEAITSSSTDGPRGRTVDSQNWRVSWFI